MKYKIVSGSDEEDLKKNVMKNIGGFYDINNKWEVGWKPFGGVAVSTYLLGGETARIFYQAMIKD